MELVENKIFYNETVVVDDKQFVNCDFEGSSLLYDGGALPTFTQCKFDRVSLQFGDAAANTLQFLSKLRHGGFSPAVDRLLDSVRKPIR